MSEPGEDATDNDAAGRPPGDMLSVGMLYGASSIPLPTTYNTDPDSGVRAASHNVSPSADVTVMVHGVAVCVFLRSTASYFIRAN